ncbi:MAG TPA: hypothetical protein VNZ64_05270 [Candidatus Acidoferrum sp.]|jgi:hypothetical protein|nr:hypothetical protein [Candidatus Acidoferrum sp.]
MPWLDPGLDPILAKPKAAKINLHQWVNGVRENDPQPTLGI